MPLGSWGSRGEGPNQPFSALLTAVEGHCETPLRLGCRHWACATCLAVLRLPLAAPLSVSVVPFPLSSLCLLWAFGIVCDEL